MYAAVSLYADGGCDRPTSTPGPLRHADGMVSIYLGDGEYGRVTVTGTIRDLRSWLTEVDDQINEADDQES